MSINVNTKKIVIVIGILLIAGLIGYSRYSTRGERKAEAEYKLLIKFANRQAVEIAIIEQRSKLLDYQQQMTATSQPKKIAQPIRPNPPMPAPFVPAMPVPVQPPPNADPKDMEIK